MLATADRTDESAGWGAAPCGRSRGRHQWRILTGEMQAVKRRGHGEARAGAAREGEASARTGVGERSMRARGPDAMPFASPSAAGLREPERPEWPFDGVGDGRRGSAAASRGTRATVGNLWSGAPASASTTAGVGGCSGGSMTGKSY